jgi:8-oxo-dGTP pyrophosphatase MutT (NUDIX family)
MPIRVRVGVAIVQEGRILLVNHRRMGRSYWVLPGGALDAGESLPECAAREVREETGLDVTVDRLLYLLEVFPKDGERHTVDVIFLGHLADETQAPRAMAGWTIERPEFVPLNDVPGLLLLPPIADEILADAAAAFSGPPRYLQNKWLDIGARKPWTASARGRPRQ